MILLSENQRNDLIIRTLFQPPVRRTVLYKEGGRFDTPPSKPYFLSFPSTIFQIMAERYNHDWYTCTMFRAAYVKEGSPEEITNFTRLYLPTLPNHFHGFEVCLGHFRNRFDTIDEMQKTLLDKYWSASFNGKMAQKMRTSVGGISEHFPGLSKSHVMLSIEAWQNATLADPQWVPTDDLIGCPAIFGPSDLASCLGEL